jgi:hypothetical protein
MSTQQQEKQPANHDKQTREQLSALIRNQVMHTLGQPANLQSVQVRQLWGDHYRVNVFAGVDSASAKVIHSYFLVADSDGNIVEVTPKITRQY